MSYAITFISSDRVGSCCQTQRVLNRSTAIQRLHHLIPGSQEYDQLQGALIKNSGITEITLPNLSYKVDSSSFEDQLLGGFGTSEHIAIGEAIQLQGLPSETSLLSLGVNSLQFQHIVALAGDFYGVAGQPISLLGGTDLEKTERFKAAFNTLAQADPNQLRKILVEIEQECTAVKYSSLPHHCYSDQMVEKHHALQRIKPDIKALLVDNSDHFSTNAEDAYRIGHSLALQEARDAGHKKNLEGLKRAYALDAFACHFLTDLFAAGHIRNQRGDLEIFLLSQLHFTGDLVKKLAGILTGAQHEKDGHEGLNVCDQKGHYWRAYGDGHFFSPKNRENKEKVIATTQHSVDEIYLAYLYPHIIKPSEMNEWIPHVIPFNPPPLYAVEGTSLFLYQGSDQIEIKTQADYIEKGLSQALRYLPQKYIDGFINFFDFQLPPLVSKVIAPQIERLTGTIWGILGVASAHQLRQNHVQLDEKINEMAEIIQTTYENTSTILEKLEKCRVQLTHLRWTHTFQEIKESIGMIKDMFYQYRHFRETLDKRQRENTIDRLWQALIRMGRLLEEGATTERVQLLPAYGSMLQETSHMGFDEMKLSLTMWLKELIDYQSHAFCMYGLLYLEQHAAEDAQPDLRRQALSFQASILKQIESNQDWIDRTLISQSPSYIALQMEKMKIKRLWILNN